MDHDLLCIKSYHRLKDLEARISTLPRKVPIPMEELENETFSGDQSLINYDEDLEEHYDMDLMEERVAEIRSDLFYATVSQAATLVLSVGGLIYSIRQRSGFPLLFSTAGAGNWARDQIDYGILSQDLTNLEGDISNCEAYARRAGHSLSLVSRDQEP